MVWLAFSLQDQVDKYGTYVGFAAFVGLAILSLLYASQAREVKRLREWAGRAPERAAELEAQAIANAEAARREPAPPVAPRVVAQPRTAAVGASASPTASVAAGGGAVTQRRAVEAAASAFAAAGGVTTALQHPPAAEPAAAEDEAEPAQAASTNGSGPPAEDAAPAPAPDGASEPATDTGEAPVLPAATPAARRAAQQPAPAADEPPAPAPAPVGAREPAPAATLASPRPASRAVPPRRGGDGPDDTLAPRRSLTSWLVVGAVGLLVVAVAVFAGTRLFGGSDDDAAAPGTQTGGGGGATPTATASPTATPDNAQTRVVVLNGTPIPQLAASTRDQLLEGDFRDSNVAAANLTVASPQETSNVYYTDAANRDRALAVGKQLRINGARQATPGDLVTRANEAYSAGGGTGGNPQVIVVAGGDRAR